MEYIDLNKCKYLGHGRNGQVYLMPDGKVIKICKKEETCAEEYEVLKTANGSTFFPRVYEKYGKAIIRDFVQGDNLKVYIKKHGLSRNLAISLINLIEEFRRLGFKRLDIRGQHIYVKKDESVMVIDPSSQKVRDAHYPKRMLDDLRKCKVEKKFYKILKEIRPDLYEQWK